MIGFADDRSDRGALRRHSPLLTICHEERSSSRGFRLLPGITVGRAMALAL